MAKRFSATEIWEEDWFLDMPNEYKLFWYYILSACDQAGFFKINIKSFSSKNNVELDIDTAFELFNKGKKRLRKVSNSVWLIEDFFKFQYGHKFNCNNKMHLGIEKIYSLHGISIDSLRGVERVSTVSKEGVNSPKDKDKDIQKEEKLDFRKMGLIPEMMKIFKSSYPHYPEDETNDYPACLSIAYRIAKQKGWMKESVTNGNMDETLIAWEKIVEFSTSDKWYATRSVSDFNKEFQRIVQGMVQKNKVPTKQEFQPQQTAPTLKYLTQE